MKPPNHGCRVRVTCLDEGDDCAEMEGFLALDPRRARHVPEETGLVLVMGPGWPLVIYTTDRIELL
jgi:hypothetical protein